MAIPVWPAMVPVAPIVTGSQAGATYGDPISSETEGGPALMRPRPGPRSTEMSFVGRPWKPAEWAAFEQFARLDLRHGTSPFRMPVYRPDGGQVDRVCQIKDGKFFSDMSLPGYVVVSFTLIVYNW